MKPHKLLKRILTQPANVKFADFTKLVVAFGFELARVRGSHHIYSHPVIREIMNIQEVSGEVKPYQIQQFLKIVERYNLRLR